MTKLLKRLELIKTAIALEDEEIIELQIMKLDNIENDDREYHDFILMSDI